MTTVEEFTQLCRDESDLVSRLVALLEEERDLLLDNQDLRLESVAQSKSQVLDSLARQAALRGQLMRRIGIQDQDSVYIWLADKPEACAAWVQLEDGLGRAQSVNQLNGAVIDQRLAQVEESLNVLRTAASATLGYGRDGQQPDVAAGGRFLGSA
nr:flagellar protein FlgN [Chromobacterium sp. ASV5]